jgi:hypothetical protein
MMMRVVQRAPSVRSTQYRPNCKTMKNTTNAGISVRFQPKTQSVKSHVAWSAIIAG